MLEWEPSTERKEENPDGRKEQGELMMTRERKQ